jgi:restriction system protein
MGANMEQSGLIKQSEITTVYTATGKISGWRVELRHTGLNEHRLLRAPDRNVLQNKVNSLRSQWGDKWERVSARQHASSTRARGKGQAEEVTAEAQAALHDAENILVASLDANNVVNWAALEDHSAFATFDRSPYPMVTYSLTGKPAGFKKSPVPDCPDSGSARYQPRLGLLDKVFAGRRATKVAAAARLYAADHDSWVEAKGHVDELNAASKREFEVAAVAYEEARAAFNASQEAANANIRELAEGYRAQNADAVLANAELILNASRYPDWIRKDYTAHFNSSSRLLVVDFQLPTHSDIPRLAKVVYVASRDEIKETYLSDAESNRLFESVIYQLALRTIHEAFQGDAANALDAVVFNGWVTAVNKSTGRDETACIVSLQARKDEFLAIDLWRVDPKACFKQLKGVAASKLSGLTPVAPIVRLDRDDPRFVASHEVTGRLDEGTNLAAIDWEDFEHLVRELFEQEFASGGGEVKVTRASSDGGVDAVIFDPDPIRGGKIVVQAKRYTNTVGVAAVRDLYGTMMNEGAMKGLLVTTSDYGPDAYTFAKDKPITLLNGSNLLHLLSKHGHKARIDLAEAKRLRESASSAN